MASGKAMVAKSVKDTQEYKDYESLLRLDLDDFTLRIRRNFMFAAASIIFIKNFGINVKEVVGVGIQLENLTTDIVLCILMIVTLYHFVMFLIRGLEQYWLQRKKIADSLSTLYNMKPVSGGVDYSIIEAIRSSENYSIIEAICTRLPSVVDIVESDTPGRFTNKKRYIADHESKKYLAFSRFTMKFRFWILDMGLAAALFIWAVWVYFCR